MKVQSLSTLVSEVNPNNSDKAQEIIAKQELDLARKEEQNIVARKAKFTVDGIEQECFYSLFIPHPSYNSLTSQGFTEDDGVHGGYSLADMVVSGYINVGKSMLITKASGRGNPEMLTKLTGGAIAPLKKGYHRSKGFFDTEGQLTGDGQLWIQARVNGNKVAYKSTSEIVSQLVQAMTRKDAKQATITIASMLDGTKKKLVFKHRYLQVVTK